MEKKNYFNFMAFRKALYDGELSERARLVYIHLLQKSSNKGCADNALYNDVELTKELIAIDLGILTREGEPSVKSIQRALEELEEHGYIKRFQKYKSKGCPLTIRLNFSQQFLRQSENKKDSTCDESESKFVHHYNPSIIPSNPFQSDNNPSNISKDELKMEFETACGVDEEMETELDEVGISSDDFNWDDEIKRFKARVNKTKTKEELKGISIDFHKKMNDFNFPIELEDELDGIKKAVNSKMYSLSI